VKTLKTLGIAIAVLMATAAVAYGADQVRDRGSEPQHDQDPDKVQLQKKLHEVSDQDVVSDALLKAKDATDDDARPTQTRDRDRDQLRDGSCGECDGDASGDGDCTQAQDCSQTQTQTQTHDGNAWDDGDAGHEGDGGGSGGTGGSGDDPGPNGDGGCGDGQGDGGCGDGGH
jgi:hypothetical protein